MKIAQRLKQGINKKIFQARIVHQRKKQYSLPPITIISSDCSGGVICHDYGLPLDSPTVNLTIEGMDFIKLCKNLEWYLQQPLREKTGGTYPVALCGDITINGIHYHNFSELNDAWTRRKNRIHKDRIIYILSTNQVSSREMLEQFLLLPIRKIVFCPLDYPLILDKESFIIVKNFNSMFHFAGLSGHRRLDEDFNFAKWYFDEEKESNYG